jgi:hypothetical protein
VGRITWPPSLIAAGQPIDLSADQDSTLVI